MALDCKLEVRLVPELIIQLIIARNLVSEDLLFYEEYEEYPAFSAPAVKGNRCTFLLLLARKHRLHFGLS